MSAGFRLRRPPSVTPNDMVGASAGVTPAALRARKKATLESPLMLLRIMSGFAFRIALIMASAWWLPGGRYSSPTTWVSAARRLPRIMALVALGKTESVPARNNRFLCNVASAHCRAGRIC